MKIRTHSLYKTIVLIGALALSSLASAMDYTGWESDKGVSGIAGDPDHDGLPNLLEYIFNTSPVSADTGLTSYDAQDSDMILRWRERKMMDPLVSLQVQERGDLLTGSWSNAVIQVGDRTTSSIDADTDEVQVILRGKSFPYFHRFSASYNGSSVSILPAPQNISASGGLRETTISWDPVAGATSYTLFYGTDSRVNTSSTKIESVTSPYVHMNLHNNQDYYYVLQANISAGSGILSAEAHARTAMGTTGIPQNLTAVSGASDITLSWDPVPHATAYKIYMYSSSLTVTTPSYVHSLPAGSLASYVVTAIGPSGESAVSERVGGESGLSNEPGNSFPKCSPMDQAVHVSWTASAHTDFYRLYWSTNGAASASSTLLGDLTGLSYQHNGLMNGVTNFYYLESINAYGTNAYTYYDAYGVPGGAPVYPDNWVFTGEATSGQATLSWEDIPGATGYDLYMASGPGVAYSTALPLMVDVSSPYVYSGLANGTEYYFYVKPKNAAGEPGIYTVSGYYRKVTPLASTSKPTQAPLVSALPANRQNLLRWSDAPDGDTYIVYWAETASVTTNSTRVPVTTTHWTHAGLENGKPYFYAVSTVNQVGEGPLSSAITSTPQEMTSAPVAPQSLSVKYAGYRRAALEWDPVPGATSYTVYWTLAGDMNGELASISEVHEPCFVHGGLSSGTTYRYAVVAENAQGASIKSSQITFRPSHTDTANAVSGTEKSYYRDGIRNRMWIPNHLLSSGNFKGILFADSHGAIKGLDRESTYRLFAERNDFLLLRIGDDDYNINSAYESEQGTLAWLQENYGFKRDLSKLPHIVVGLSSSARSACGYSTMLGDRCLATVAYAQPVRGTDLRIPFLMAVGSQDGLSYAHTVSESKSPENRSNYGAFSSVLFNQGYPHNSIGRPYHATRWLSAIIEMRLRPDGTIAPVNAEKSVLLDYTATFDSNSYLTSVSAISLDPNFEQYGGKAWVPNMDLAQEWEYARHHPYAFWLETPEADGIPVNWDTTISSKTGDSNNGGTVASAIWSLASGPGNATFGSTSAAETTVRFDAAGNYTVRLTITDNEGNVREQELTLVAGDSRIEFSATRYTVAENGATATISVKRLGSTTNAISVDYTTSDATATAGSDYTPASGTLTWTAGDAADKTFDVTIMNNATHEGDKTVSMTLSNAIGTAISGSNPVTLTITEDDLPDNFTLSYAAGANGSMSGTATQIVPEGSSGSAITAVPDTGYYFVSWSDASTQNPRTDLNVTHDITVTANFVSTENMTSINFGSNMQPLSASDTAGVIPATNWNNLPNTSGSVTDILNGHGMATTMDVTYSAHATWFAGGTASSDEKMMRGYLDGSRTGALPTVTISQVPYALYDVYVYHQVDVDGNGGSVTLNGTESKYIKDASSTFSGSAGNYAEDIQGASFNSTTAGHYIKFSGVTGTSVSITCVRDLDRMGFAGIQIVNTPAP